MGTIAQKLDYLNDTRLLLKDNINKINNVLTDQSTFRSYPQELFNGYLDILNNGTDTLWNNLTKVSQADVEEAELSNVVTAPMKIALNGNTSQDGTPTPDTPVEVKVVKGENVVSVSGKNKFNIDDILIGTKINDRTFTATHVNGKLIEMDFNPNLKYNIGFKIRQDHESNGVFVRIMYTDGTNVTMTSTSTDTVSKTILTTKAIREILLQYSAYNTITTFEDFYIYEETSDTDYVPYSKTDYPISLGTIEMCKIGDYKDYLHKDSGKWFVHKEIEKLVLDGTQTISSYNTSSTNTTRVSYHNLVTNMVGVVTLLCNMLPQKNNWNNDTEGISYNAQNRDIWFRISKSTIGTTQTETNSFLATNNMIIYYALATPTEEEITNTTLIEQLEAISKAKSVKDKTYITQTNDDLPFILDVEAIKEYEVV